MSSETLIITSLTNARVKAIRALEMRKERKASGLFVAEGASILLSAAEQRMWPETLVLLAGSVTTDKISDYLRDALKQGTEILQVSQAVLEKLAAKDNPQTMLGVFCQRLVHPPDPVGTARAQTWLALEEIRDPGNLGTIIRTADATGTAGILLVGTTCDPWSRECIRATMGSIFAVPLARIEHANFHKLLRAWPSQTVGTHLTATQDFRSTKIRAPALIVMGGEGPGLTDEAARACKTLVKIPMIGKLDSLNLAVATALMLYQVQSQNLTVSG